MNNASSTLYHYLEWVTKLAYLNVLWILFTLAGVVLLGIYPSTVAMFAICRQWLKGNTDFPLFPTFWKYFKTEFVKSNLLGIIISIILSGVVLNILFINTENPSQLVIVPLFAFMIIASIFFMYIFPTFVHFDQSIPQIVKNTFLILLVSPLQILLMIVSMAALLFIMYLLPALAFIFGGSASAFLIMWLALSSFKAQYSKRAAHNS